MIYLLKLYIYQKKNEHDVSMKYVDLNNINTDVIRNVIIPINSKV